MDITVLRPDDTGSLSTAYAVRAAAASHDVPGEPAPCWFQFQGRAQVPRSGFEQRLYLLRDGADVVGGYRLEFPMLENLDAAVLELLVAPRHRGVGAGRKLLEHAGRLAREAGRGRLVLDAHSPLPPEPAGATAAFLEAVGARPLVDFTWHRLELDETTTEGYGHLLKDAEGRSTRYETVSWMNEAPGFAQDDMAKLMGYALSDQPMDSLDWRPAPWTAERLEGYDRLLHACRTTRFTTAVRDRENGDLVAETTLAVAHSTREYAMQCETIVIPRHRRHGLGTRLKIGNIRFARTNEPRLRWIDSWVTGSNRPMATINETLGFRPHRKLARWQLAL
jgi:GNAT superfamily N-acetyltransferase